MYLGYLSEERAEQQNLWRLTLWDRGDASFEGVYYRGRKRIVESMLWAAWCESDAQRIARDPRRKAAVVERGRMLSVFVNRVAGDRREDVESDEGED